MVPIINEFLAVDGVFPKLMFGLDNLISLVDLFFSDWSTCFFQIEEDSLACGSTVLAINHVSINSLFRVFSLRGLLCWTCICIFYFEYLFAWASMLDMHLYFLF